ncbi:MAG: aromatic ring-hydroxylating dioxygenase subunit alpha, partial [Myxococcales bacterium]|nr:aromatic ring-hydroxylating dioxygenase subunit alpha [Myxococcales bacterium]
GSLLLVHDGEGPAAYFNVCPHRGHPLCSAPTGRVKELVCPYHHWTFGLDGRCRSIPDAQSFSPRLVARTELRRLRLETRFGLIWVNASSDGPPLEDYLGPVGDWLAGYGLDDWHLDAEVSVPLACNWKASTDVHNESYHLAALHPEAMPLVDDAAAQQETVGWHGRIRVPMGRSSAHLKPQTEPHPALVAFLAEHGVAAHEHGDTRTAYLEALRRRADAPAAWAQLSDEQLVDNHMIYVFPNLQLNLHRDHAMLFRHRPVSHDRCLFDQLNLTRRLPPRPPAPRETRADDPIIGPVTGADLRAAEALQRSYASGALERLTLSRREQLIARMHAGLDAFVPGESSSMSPPAMGDDQPQK